MLLFLHIVESLFVKILVRSFLEVSSNIIGLVLIKSHSQSLAFGIGNIVLVFHDGRLVPLSRQREKNFLNAFLASPSSFFNISYLILETPLALPLGRSLSVVLSSSSVTGSISSLNHSFLTPILGWYSFFQSSLSKSKLDSLVLKAFL